ncbi:hypothetical protein MRX96_012442 [Rhipicephalus microplus]
MQLHKKKWGGVGGEETGRGEGAKQHRKLLHYSHWASMRVRGSLMGVTSGFSPSLPEAPVSGSSQRHHHRRRPRRRIRAPGR